MVMYDNRKTLLYNFGYTAVFLCIKTKIKSPMHVEPIE